MYYNTYLTLLDATREAARFSANGSMTCDSTCYMNYDAKDSCIDDPSTTTVDERTTDFYKQARCLVMQNLQGVRYDAARDDIIVSVVQIKDGVVIARYPYTGESFRNNGGDPQNGWSYCRNTLNSVGCTPLTSLFSTASLNARITTVAPKSAWVIVELYHVHPQFLGLIPPGLPFLPHEVMMHAYTIMPVPSAAQQIPD